MGSKVDKNGRPGTAFKQVKSLSVSHTPQVSKKNTSGVSMSNTLLFNDSKKIVPRNKLVKKFQKHEKHKEVSFIPTHSHLKCCIVSLLII